MVIQFLYLWQYSPSFFGMRVTSPQQGVGLRLGDYVSCDYLQAHRLYQYRSYYGQYDRCRRYVYLIITGGDMWTLSLVPTSSLIVALNRVFVFNTCNIQNRNSSLYFARFYIHPSVRLQHWIRFSPNWKCWHILMPIAFAINHHHHPQHQTWGGCFSITKEDLTRESRRTFSPSASSGRMFILVSLKCKYKNKHTYR